MLSCRQIDGLSSRGVFKTKLFPEGPIDKFKARLISKGFQQRLV